MKKFLKASLAITSAFVILTGCTSEPAQTDKQPVASENKSPDNEIFIYTVYPAFYAKEDIWEKQVGQYLKKKFPDLTFKHVQWDNPGGNIRI